MLPVSGSPYFRMFPIEAMSPPTDSIRLWRYLIAPSSAFAASCAEAAPAMSIAAASHAAAIPVFRAIRIECMHSLLDGPALSRRGARLAAR